MRGRHAYAMLKMMGLNETIAADKSAYCRIAVALANDQRFRKEVKIKLRDRRDRLYADQLFINGLERFYQSIVQQKLSTGKTESEQSTC
jgi:predicted O-linked N-acetylglucosamine transferase (SPINDLY family)